MSVTSSSSGLNFRFFVSDCLNALEWCGRRRTNSVAIAETADNGMSSHGADDLCNKKFVTTHCGKKNPGKPHGTSALFPHNLNNIMLTRSNPSKRHVANSWQFRCKVRSGTCVPTYIYNSCTTFEKTSAVDARGRAVGAPKLHDESDLKSAGFSEGCDDYQMPLSLPVIRNATAAADARYGSSDSRRVAGTSPRRAV
jgi:hypothetical protein